MPEQKLIYLDTPAMLAGYIQELIKQAKSFEDYVFLQHIGIKDKNGKDIYEYDIIKSDRKYWEGKKINIGNVYQRGCAYYVAKIPMHIFESNEIEVIGNVYENSEIIEEINDQTRKNNKESN